VDLGLLMQTGDTGAQEMRATFKRLVPRLGGVANNHHRGLAERSQPPCQRREGYTAVCAVHLINCAPKLIRNACQSKNIIVCVQQSGRATYIQTVPGVAAEAAEEIQPARENDGTILHGHR